MKRFRFSALSLAVVLAASAAGCMTPPVVWRHDAKSKSFGSSGRALLIEPVDDRREPYNEEGSWLNLVPLVLWTTETDHLFEWDLLRNGTRRHSVRNSKITFEAASDLQRAMVRQLAASRAFGPIFLSAEESGPWKEKKPRQWSLKTNLNQLTIRHAHIRYGLGPFAFLAFMFGAPQRRVSLAIDFHLVLRDADGNLRHESRAQTTEYCYDGWYHSLDAEQRLLNDLSFILGDEMDMLQEKCCSGKDR